MGWSCPWPHHFQHWREIRRAIWIADADSNTNCYSYAYSNTNGDSYAYSNTNYYSDCYSYAHSNAYADAMHGKMCTNTEAAPNCRASPDALRINRSVDPSSKESINCVSSGEAAS